MSKQFEKHDTIRILDSTPGSIDEFAKVVHVYGSGRVWVSNLNSPYSGTISNVVDSDTIEFCC